MKKLIFILFSILSFLFSQISFAAEDFVIPPPLISIYNKQVSNEEIFYVGGSATEPEAKVIVYIQKEDGAILTQEIETNNLGQWFYSHPEFLAKGKYIIWAQLKAGELLSPPSPQIVFEVAKTALQIGDWRIGLEVFYAALFLIFLLISAGLLIFIFYHARGHTGKKHLLDREIAEAEKIVLHGFANLQRELNEELNILGERDAQRKNKILQDLRVIEQYMGKELDKLGKMDF